MKKLLPILFLIACSEEIAPPGGATQRDAAAVDVVIAADVRAADADPIDAAIEDVFTPDTAQEDAAPEDVSFPDATPADVSPLDASDPDAGMTCGRIGTNCDVREGCGGGNVQCVEFHEVCLPFMPTCGGFVGMMCPNTAPYCHFFVGADYGPCFTASERACACNSARGRAALVGCP